VLEVAATYFDIVRQQRLVDASAVAHERAVRLKTASEARMSVGLATRLDVLRADLLVSQAVAGLDDRQTALADAEDRLKLLIGHPVNSALRIAGDDLDEFIGAYEVTALQDGAMVQRVDEPAAAGLDSALVYSAEQGVAAGLEEATAAALRPFVATALGNRVDVQQARARVEDAELAASVATWRLMPDVTLNASYSQQGLGTPWGAAFNELYGGWSVGITTSYTLDRAPQMAAFSSASLSARAAERDLAELHERVAAEVRRAHRGIVRADKGIAIQAQAVELSQKQLELAELRYERGLADNFDIIDAETNLFNAQSALVSARVDRALAGLALELAMGLLDPEEYAR
jgi:outer membrane protein TolC